MRHGEKEISHNHYNKADHDPNLLQTRCLDNLLTTMRKKTTG
jgi:hypothetical protein